MQVKSISIMGKCFQGSGVGEQVHLVLGLSKVSSLRTWEPGCLLPGHILASLQQPGNLNIGSLGTYYLLGFKDIAKILTLSKSLKEEVFSC